MVAVGVHVLESAGGIVPKDSKKYRSAATDKMEEWHEREDEDVAADDVETWGMDCCLWLHRADTTVDPNERHAPAGSLPRNFVGGGETRRLKDKCGMAKAVVELFYVQLPSGKYVVNSRNITRQNYRRGRDDHLHGSSNPLDVPRAPLAVPALGEDAAHPAEGARGSTMRREA